MGDDRRAGIDKRPQASGMIEMMMCIDNITNGFVWRQVLYFANKRERPLFI